MLKLAIFIALCMCLANAEKFFIKNAGHLHLSEQKWEIQHILNLTEYVETTNILMECVDTLNDVCENGTNPLCSYFERATRSINTEVQEDTLKLKNLSRQKRYMVLIPTILGKSMVALWVEMILQNSAIKSIKEEIHGNLDIMKQAANISISSTNLMQGFIGDNDQNMMKFRVAINNNTKNIDSLTRFFTVINVISLSVQLHEKIQIKLNDIYYGDINSRLFEIIDFEEFSNTMKTINKSLEPDLTLPNILTMSRNKFIKTYMDYNSTHLTISTDLPVMRKKGFNMVEFTPLPFEENGKTYILDMPTTMYYENASRILLFPDERTKNLLCKTQDGVTICNSFLEDYSVNASNCMQNLLKNNSDVGCTYKEIPKQNYFIKLTDGITYLHLQYPIKIVVDCRGRIFAMTVMASGKSYLPSGCEIYKYNENTQYGGERISRLIKDLRNNTRSEINLFNATDSYKKLSYIPLYDKYNLQLIECKKRVTRFKKDVELQEENINKISTSPSFGIYDFFNDTIVQILIFGSAIILILLIMKSLLMKLLTNWNE